MTTEQKEDLLLWVRIREQSNRPLRKNEIMTAIVKFVMVNEKTSLPSEFTDLSELPHQNLQESLCRCSYVYVMIP